ncbi:MAG: hypothetical protein GY793_01405 [Proteobacteria bacterium]|nr:hypothetical protein [Pseudomonadota bacterium]
MKESWKFHPKTKKYKISSLGRVISFQKYKDGKLLKQNKDTSGYIRYNFVVNGICRQRRVHRLVAELFLPNEYCKSLIVDHKDRNRENNNVENLRMTNNSGNSINSSKPKNKSSRFKGVYWCSERSKWSSEIMFNRKHYTLGRFLNEQDAAEAYDKKCLELHGEYASTNKMLDLY